MTKAACRKKVRQLAKDLAKEIEAEAMRLYSCRGIDPDDYEDNYILPKILVSAAAQAKKDVYYPLFKADKQTVKNLEHF